MAQSPRPPGPVRGRWARRGACALSGPKAQSGWQIRSQVGAARPGLGAVSVSPKTSLGRDGPSKRSQSRPARACMTQHDLAQAPTQAQHKPCLGARVRSWARWVRVLIRPLPLLPSPSFLSSLPRRAHSQARLGLPSAVGPRCAHPQGSGRARAHTHSLRRPWRALHPAGGCGGPQVTALRGGERQPGPGLSSPGVGVGASGGDKPAGLLSFPPSGTRAVDERAGDAGA